VHTLWRMGALMLAGYRTGLMSSSLLRWIFVIVIAAAAITWIRRGAA
jgi:hypothetical protein